MNDYYDGYYWGINPYSSSSLEGKISDTELMDKVIDRIDNMDRAENRDIKISVSSGIVTLNGSVRTIIEKRSIGEEIWHIIGVSKLLNLLKVSDPRTAGPQNLIDHRSYELGATFFK